MYQDMSFSDTQKNNQLITSINYTKIDSLAPKPKSEAQTVAYKLTIKTWRSPLTHCCITSEIIENVPEFELVHQQTMSALNWSPSSLSSCW